MAYVDGFIVPVKKKKVAAYKKIAQKAGKLWMKHGALEYKECLADDVSVGKWTSFPRSVKLKKDEVVFFSYIVYKNRKQRDSVTTSARSEPRSEIKRSSAPTVSSQERSVRWMQFGGRYESAAEAFATAWLTFRKMPGDIVVLIESDFR